VGTEYFSKHLVILGGNPADLHPFREVREVLGQPGPTSAGCDRGHMVWKSVGACSLLGGEGAPDSSSHPCAVRSHAGRHLLFPRPGAWRAGAHRSPGAETHEHEHPSINPNLCPSLDPCCWRGGR